MLIKNRLEENYMKRAIEWIAVGVIFVIALGVRIAYVHTTVVDTPLRGDAAVYFNYGYNLANYGTFSSETPINGLPDPDSYWAPGFPTLLAAAIWVVGEESFYPLVLYTHALLGALTATLTVLLGRLFLPLLASTIAGILVAFSPHLISIGGLLLTETLFAFALITAIYTLCLGAKSKKVWLLALASLIMGAAFLINPVIFFAPFILYLLIWYSTRGNKSEQDLKPALVAFVVLFLVVAGAWMVRNSLNVMPGSASSVDRVLENLIIGAHENFHDLWRKNPRDPQNPVTIDQQAMHGSWMKFLRILSSRIEQDPWHYLVWYTIKKPVLLWSWNIKIGWDDIYVYPVFVSLYHVSKPMLVTYSLMKSMHYWLTGFALIGFFLMVAYREEKRSRLVQVVLYAILIYVSLVYIALQSEPRYSIALRPEMYLAAIFAITKISEILSRKRESPINKWSGIPNRI